MLDREEGAPHNSYFPVCVTASSPQHSFFLLSHFFRTSQVVTLDSGAIIGDITVLASVKRRTASVIATSEMLTYKIRRAVFLRRLPPDQLEVRVARLVCWLLLFFDLLGVYCFCAVQSCSCNGWLVERCALVWLWFLSSMAHASLIHCVSSLAL